MGTRAKNHRAINVFRVIISHREIPSQWPRVRVFEGEHQTAKG